MFISNKVYIIKDVFHLFSKETKTFVNAGVMIAKKQVLWQIAYLPRVLYAYWMKNRHLLVFTTGLRNFRPEKNWVEKYFKDVADFKVLTVPTTDRGLDVDARELTQKIKEVSKN